MSTKMQNLIPPYSRIFFLEALAASSVACSSSSRVGSGTGGAGGEAGEGNASGGSDGEGGNSGEVGSSGEGGEGGSTVADPTCRDGVLNGDETDVDCGGPDCKQCSAGRSCEAPSDCQSQVCEDGTCAQAACGDGVVNRSSEDCDDGELNSDTDADACRTNCKLPSCGDGVVDQEELCDDGNQEDDLTCAADCRALSLAA